MSFCENNDGLCDNYSSKLFPNKNVINLKIPILFELKNVDNKNIEIGEGGGGIFLCPTTGS